MIGRVYVMNVRGKGVIEKDNFIYCGRKCGVYEGGILGNYVGKGLERYNAIRKFRLYLWEEINKKGVVYDELIRIRDILLSGDDVWLGCWCYPKMCHCDVIKSGLLWMMDNMD